MRLTLFTLENLLIRQEMDMHENYVLVEHIRSSFYSTLYNSFYFYVKVLSVIFIFFFSKAFLVDIFARPNSDGSEHTYDNAGHPSARRTDREESKNSIS